MDHTNKTKLNNKGSNTTEVLYVDSDHEEVERVQVTLTQLNEDDLLSEMLNDDEHSILDD